jgi:aryl-alcohol dehydrogenase-like predicted oxidoreductase
MDPTTPIEDTMRTLKALVEEGNHANKQICIHLQAIKQQASCFGGMSKCLLCR